MIGRLTRLFQRYASRHGQIERPGFPLWDGEGGRIGYVDRIVLRDGRLQVDGWTLAGDIGLASEEIAVRKVPDLMRDDVATSLGLTDIKTPGFSIDLPAGAARAVFWAEVKGTRYVYALPDFGAMDLRRMRQAQLKPFLRDGLRALPHALHWLLRRDAPSVARVKAILRMNAVAPSGVLNTLIFAEDVDVDTSPPAALAETGITIVLPVYNAFDLLPEVLDRVLRHTDLPWRMIVVEDCSSDEQVRPWLRDWHGALPPEVQAQVSVLENEKNLGFIRSVNRAFEAALPHGDHVVLLNSDAFVPAGWASRLLRPFLEHDNVASVTPMSNDAEIFDAPVICQRMDLVPGEADAIDQVAAQFFPDAVLADAPTGVGFCMAMHIDYLAAEPTFDTAFGRGYGEEVDWCQRVRRRGGRHLGLGGLFVEHRGGTSFGSEEKLKLVRKNNETIARRYTGYDQEVQDFIRNDPMVSPRLALALAWVAQRQTGPVPIYLAHSLGGGADNYLKARVAEDLTTDAAAVVLRVGGSVRWTIEVHTADGVTRGETDQSAFLRRLMALLPARHVIYSCGVGDRDACGLPEELLALAEGPHDQVTVLIHDFLPLSPSYTLLGGDGIYHGLPDPATNRDRVHDIRRSDGSTARLADWRAAWGTLMQAAGEITVFSEDSRRLVAEAYPQAAGQIVVRPHQLLVEVPEVTPGRPADGVPVIGVLGNIGYQKGAAVLRDLSKHLAETGAARLVVVGNLDPAYGLASPAIVHGDYQISDIPALVQRYGISSWLMPSVWPETFSYTTHETLATGLPVWCFDLGAQGDAVAMAVRNGAPGGTLPLDKIKTDVGGILDPVLTFREKETT